MQTYEHYNNKCNMLQVFANDLLLSTCHNKNRMQFNHLNHTVFVWIGTLGSDSYTDQ